MNSKFYWQKDGVNITKRYKYRGTTTDTLTLLNATENDQGIYTLIVSMEAENQQLSVILSIGKSVLLVLYLHLHCLIICIFTVVPVTIVIYTLIEPVIGLQYKLTCNVTGANQFNPRITYQWFKDGEMILGENHINWTRFSLKYGDAGEYRCITNISSKYLNKGYTVKTSNDFKLCIPCKLPQK